MQLDILLLIKTLSTTNLFESNAFESIKNCIELPTSDTFGESKDLSYDERKDFELKISELEAKIDESESNNRNLRYKHDDTLRSIAQGVLGLIVFFLIVIWWVSRKKSSKKSKSKVYCLGGGAPATTTSPGFVRIV